MLTETEVKAIRPLRYLRKVSDGGGLYLLVTPKGGRWWRYAYRFALSTRHSLWESIPTFLWSKRGHVTGSLAIYSSMDSIRRR